MAVPDVHDVAGELRITLGTLIRRLRAHRNPGDPSVPEITVLARLDRGGPTTAAELARREQISPQSIGVTVAALLERGLLERRPDPADGRSRVLHLTDDGVAALDDRRNHRSRALADAMAANFTDAEIAEIAAALPLLDRLGQVL